MSASSLWSPYRARRDCDPDLLGPSPHGSRARHQRISIGPTSAISRRAMRGARRSVRLPVVSFTSTSPDVAGYHDGIHHRWLD